MTTVRVARSFEEAEEFRPAWEQLENDRLTSDMDFVLTYCRYTPGVLRPHIVLLEEAGEPVALAAGRLEETRLPARLGYKVVLDSRVRALTVVYGGLLGDTASLPALLSAVGDSVKHERLDLVRFRMLELGSPQHSALTDASPLLRKHRFAQRLRHWRAALPGTLDDFLAQRSRRRRESVRRYSRRLERTYGDEARVEVVRDGAGLDKLFAESKVIHRETYQHVLGVGFSDETVQRRLAELTADRGWFRGYMLYLRDKPVAFWHGNVYRGSFGVMSTGFDPAFAEDRPGTYLLMRAVEDLSGEGSAKVMDFGFGDADYKRHFGDGFVEEQDVGIFERRPATIGLNAIHSMLGGATAAARAVAGSTGALTNLRRRRRLSGSTSLIRSFFSVVLIVLAVYAGAGLVAGPRDARGPDHTMSSELVVDGVRRPEKTKPLRAPVLLAEGPDDNRAPATEAPRPTLRAAA
ncbi:MAG TPA: GNAT family N-acetyltransferase [Gaiellaceae bacterium]|nr:GNAT family N-acetyltransferase [Gaiellaceae bacterium]